jgi:hypothetical protein
MIGETYTQEEWEKFMLFLLNAENGLFSSPLYGICSKRTVCPMCGDAWEIERGEDLCWCQFFKRQEKIT